MTRNDILAELSYAYLHAIASRAGFSCQVADRISDAHGVDARVGWKERFDASTVHTNDDFRVQLKATTKQPKEEDERLSYFLEDVARYDQLRARAGRYPTLLVVLFVPENEAEWLTLDHDALTAKRCAYWVSLWDAPATTNRSGVTVFLPRANILTVENLRRVVQRFAVEEDVVYVR
jgi:hypothetical protein